MDSNVKQKLRIKGRISKDIPLQKKKKERSLLTETATYYRAVKLIILQMTWQQFLWWDAALYKAFLTSTSMIRVKLVNICARAEGKSSLGNRLSSRSVIGQSHTAPAPPYTHTRLCSQSCAPLSHTHRQWLISLCLAWLCLTLLSSVLRFSSARLYCELVS